MIILCGNEEKWWRKTPRSILGLKNVNLDIRRRLHKLKHATVSPYSTHRVVKSCWQIYSQCQYVSCLFIKLRYCTTSVRSEQLAQNCLYADILTWISAPPLSDTSITLSSLVQSSTLPAYGKDMHHGTGAVYVKGAVWRWWRYTVGVYLQSGICQD